MKTPSDLGSFAGVPLEADEAELRTTLRVFLVASLIMMAVFVPFVLAIVNPTSSQAETATVEAAPAETMLLWVPKDDSEQKTYMIDHYAVTLSTHVHSNGERVAHLRVRAPTGETMSIHGQVGYPIPSAGFAVGRLDPLSATEQILFTSYTGGLHCCTKITVLELVNHEWRKIQLGLWDGDPLSDYPADVDGDGAPDFVLKDDRFDYAFAPYTERHKPLRIFNVEGARAIEVGHEARYDKVYEAEMKRARPGCVKGKNAACAAFVASAARLGRRDWAWEIMLAHYHRSTDWDFPMKCRVAKVDGLCPNGQSEQFGDFPDALAWFLTDTGYVTRNPFPPAQAALTGHPR